METQNEQVVHSETLRKVALIAAKSALPGTKEWGYAFNNAIDEIGRDAVRAARSFFAKKGRAKLAECHAEDNFDVIEENDDDILGVALEYKRGSPNSGTRAIYRSMASAFDFIPQDKIMEFLFGKYNYSATRAVLRSEGFDFRDTEHGFIVTDRPESANDKIRDEIRGIEETLEALKAKLNGKR